MMADGVLSDMDWDDGIQVPVANDENKALELELIKLQAELQADTGLAASLDDRIAHMTDHSKNVQQELKHNLALVEAHSKEISTEEHLFALADREEGRLVQEQRKMDKQLNDIREKRNGMENKIFTLEQELDEVKQQINWDQQALEAWLEESARRDEDAITLQKYSSEDESKVKQLSLQMERMAEELGKKRRSLEQEENETYTAQLALDKAAEEFQQAHAERKQLIERWEKTIEQMQKRDREMDRAAADLAKVKEEVRSRENLINEKQSFLAKETRNNEELERSIAQEERGVAKLRLDFQDHETVRIQIQNDLDTLRYTVERTASDLNAMKSACNQLRKEIEDKENRLAHSSQVRAELESKLARISGEKLSAEERSDLAQRVFEEEEAALASLEKTLRDTRTNEYKLAKKVQAIANEEKVLSAEIHGTRASNRNLASRLKKCDAESLKQQEILYNQEFLAQTLQRRLARMEGEVSPEEKMELEERMAGLKQTLNTRLASLNLILSQIKSIRDQSRQVTAQVERVGKEKERIGSKIKELEVHIDSSIKLRSRLIEQKHDEMVEVNVMKLQVGKVQDVLNNKCDHVTTLEQQRLHMSTAMKERQDEIRLHREMLFAQIKSADEEQSVIKSELHQRTEKIDKLKKRYELSMTGMKGEDEEEKTAAYYVIKAAQEKEELQRKGDELDGKIRKSEKEIRALENTLRLVNSRNDTYRKTFAQVSETSEEFEEKRQLEQQLRHIVDTYKYKRRQIRELQEDLQTMSGAMDSLMRDESAYGEMIEDKKNKIKQLERDLVDQKAKLDRVRKQLGRYTREVRTKRDERSQLFEERDMDMREVRERNKQLNKAICQLIQQYPDVANTMDIYFQQSGLPTPTTTGGKHGSGGSSRGSSRSASLASSARSTPRSSAPSSARSGGRTRTVDLGLDLNLTAPGSGASSVASHRR